MQPVNIKFFKSADELRKWLGKNHVKTPELWVGFYKKDSGRGGITYVEAVDEALCFGWIDGIRKGIDGSSYVSRFTPRKPRTIWSTINTTRRRTARVGAHDAGRVEGVGGARPVEVVGNFVRKQDAKAGGHP